MLATVRTVGPAPYPVLVRTGVPVRYSFVEGEFDVPLAVSESDPSDVEIHWDGRPIGEWIRGRGDLDGVLDRVRALNEHLLAFEPHVQAGFVTRLKGEQREMRRILLRIDAIRGTSFVAAGYVLADVTAAILVGGLLLSDLGRLGEAVFLVGVITFVLRFMAALVRDLDNPFEYRQGEEGAADVSLAPLDALAARLAPEAEQAPLVTVAG